MKKTEIIAKLTEELGTKAQAEKALDVFINFFCKALSEKDDKGEEPGPRRKSHPPPGHKYIYNKREEVICPE